MFKFIALGKHFHQMVKKQFIILACFHILLNSQSLTRLSTLKNLFRQRVPLAPKSKFVRFFEDFSLYLQEIPSFMSLFFVKIYHGIPETWLLPFFYVCLQTPEALRIYFADALNIFKFFQTICFFIAKFSLCKSNLIWFVLPFLTHC